MSTTSARPVVTCLQCGESRDAVKAGRNYCVVMEGYETPEVAHEWAHHRWADWTDAELERFGVKPEAYERHRRDDALTFQWVACDDTLRGHVYATSVEADDLELLNMKPGRCFLCGKDDPALAEAD